MKNYSKKGRKINYKDTDKGKYLSSKNSKNIDELKYFEKKSLESMEIRLNFLKKTRPNDKVLLLKCQNLIASKKKQQ
jgi:hypothetical protein